MQRLKRICFLGFLAARLGVNYLSQSVDSEQVRAALTKICASSAFANSTRLQTLLAYVIEEKLAGRGSKIRAKTIGLDVHKYSPEELADREGVVRVDAGRVRRKLEEYYAQDGVSDDLVISLPVGAYVPEFETKPDRSGVNKAEPSKHQFARPALGLLAVTIAIIATVHFWSDKRLPSVGNDVADTDRLGVYDISPVRVEAANLAAIGRDLIFPAVDQRRLALALEVFSAAIEKDDTYYGGYAGAAQVHAMVSLLTLDPDLSASALQKAGEFSQTALRLEPNEAWALSATAWVQFASGGRDSAKSLSQRAVQLSPFDPHIAEFDALIALYNTDFQHIIDFAQARAEDVELGRNFVFQNALGSAQFHTGDYHGAILTFEDAVASGAPFGPISIAYLAASYQLKGEPQKAAALALLLDQTWPDARPDELQRRLFSSTEPPDQLTEALRAAAGIN